MFTPTRNTISSLFVKLIPALCAIAAGCADNPANMVPELTPGTTVPGSVAVKASGGTGGNTNLTADEIKSALETSLQQAAVFKTIDQDGHGDYQMEVVFTTEEPAAGLDMTVQLQASYTLIRRTNDTVVWTQSVDSSCTKTVGDAFAGGQREIMAEEGAVKSNIETAMHALQKAAPRLR